MQLSENAAAALENIRENQEIPEAHGIRLAADHQPSGEVGFRLVVVEEISETDEVVEQAGTELYVDPQISEPLADVVMDVQEEGDGLAFVFRQQEA